MAIHHINAEAETLPITELNRCLEVNDIIFVSHKDEENYQKIRKRGYQVLKITGNLIITDSGINFDKVTGNQIHWKPKEKIIFFQKSNIS